MTTPSQQQAAAQQDTKPKQDEPSQFSPVRAHFGGSLSAGAVSSRGSCPLLLSVLLLSLTPLLSFEGGQEVMLPRAVAPGCSRPCVRAHV